MLRIEKIQFFNHPILNNLVLDFLKSNGDVFDTIVLAGENGSGKTTILNYVNSISKYSFIIRQFNQPSDTTIILKIMLKFNENIYFDENNNLIKNAELSIYNDSSVGTIKWIVSGSHVANKVYTIKNGVKEEVDKFKLNSVYSKTDINYIPLRQVNSVTSKKLDDMNFDVPADLATETIQLLVDIATQDDHDVAQYAREHSMSTIPNDIVDKKMKRFSNAFRTVFLDRLKYKRMNNNIIPIFEKNNKEIKIEELSSGEKQIVFRGTYILKNQGNIKEVIVLIDEPEISMHPIWEEKILNYYVSLLKDINNYQMSQLFVSTHSEHVLKTALEDENTLIIKLKENGYSEKFFKGSNNSFLNIVTLSEIKWKIFDIPTIDFHIELYGFIQANKVCDSTGSRIYEPNIKQTDEWLKSKVNGNTSLLRNWIYSTMRNNIHTTITYESLPSYIRNCIDHPDGISNIQSKYSDQDLINSIVFMISLI